MRPERGRFGCRSAEDRLCAALAAMLLGVGLMNCSTPAPRNLRELVRRGDLYLDRSSMEPYAGPVFTYLEGDTTKLGFTGTLEGGLLEGSFEDRQPTDDIDLVSVEGEYQQGTYRMGKREGPSEIYYADGSLKGKAIYVAGKLNGAAEYYHEDGALDRRGRFVDAERDGVWEFFYPDQNPWMVTTYSHGVLDGPDKWFHPNGHIFKEGSYVNGAEHGKWLQYTDDGRVVTETNYVRGAKHGLHESRLNDGTFLSGGRYHAGQQCGIWWEPRLVDRELRTIRFTYPACPPSAEPEQQMGGL